MTRPSRLLYLALILGLLAGLTALASAQTTPPDPRFGAVESYIAPDLASQLNVGWDRLAIHWYERQPNNDSEWIVPGEETQALADAQSAGREVVGLFIGTAPWASQNGSSGGVPNGLKLPREDPGNPGSVYRRRRVTEYQGQIRHWIIWNEPDIAPNDAGAQFEGTVQDYYQLLKVAYLVAKQANPQAVIHLAGLTYWHDIVNKRTPYLQRLLDVAHKDPTAAAYGDYFDVLSLHIYFRSETVPDIVGFFKQILRRNRLNKPIWLNETNAAPNDDPQQLSNPLIPVTQAEQAAFIVQATALALGVGVERVAVYKLIDDHLSPGSEPYGLFRMDKTARPAATAFGTATRLFAGTETASLLTRASYYLVTLNQGAGITRVLWARGRFPIKVRLAPTRQATQTALYDHLGQPLELPPLQSNQYAFTLPGADCRPKVSCPVGGPPLILVEKWP